MPATYQDVEQAIRDVPGVSSASIGAVEGTGRGRLRIRLEPGHDPDEVSQAVADMLRRRFGIDVDPAAIRPRPAEDVEPDAPLDHVTEPEEIDVRDEAPATVPAGAGASADARTAEPPHASTPQPSAPPAASAASSNGTSPNGSTDRSVRVVGFARPTIEGLAIGATGLEVSVDAKLSADGRELVGRAVGAATRKSTLRTIARATLDAVEQLFPGRVKTELESLELSHDGEDEVATVTVTFLTHEGADKLIGVSIVRGDPEQAVMRATLDAVNRRVGLMVEETVAS